MRYFVFNRFLALILLAPFSISAQILYSNGAVLQVTNSGVLHCNGGVVLGSGTSFTNQGTVNTTKNSSLLLPGSFSIQTGANVVGNGSYSVEQDWINDGVFQAQSSTVYLVGNTEQFITSNSGINTTFNHLILTGVGNGLDRRKTLLGVDAIIGNSGSLQLNDRELFTETNELQVLNSAPLAVSNDLTFGSEGFVSSVAPGYLSWVTNAAASYVFPVGSSDTELRYRPVLIAPSDNGLNTFKVRMNNASASTSGYDLSLKENDISTLNALFFHSIVRASGISSADVAIAYLPSEDGAWGGIANWKSGDLIWKSIGEVQSLGLNNYEALQRIAWDFPDPDHLYVLINADDELIIPNVFTPNQDGVNDEYFVKGKNITEFEMVIVNRWGNVVFESNDIQQAWDGKSNGIPCEEGTYFYMIRAKSGITEFAKQGHITLTGH